MRVTDPDILGIFQKERGVKNLNKQPINSTATIYRYRFRVDGLMSDTNTGDSVLPAVNGLFGHPKTKEERRMSAEDPKP